MTHFGLDQMTQAHVGLSQLSLIGEPYIYPFMGLGFLNDLLIVVFQIHKESENLGIQPSKVHSLECHGHGSSHQAKDFGCARPLEHSTTLFIRWISIWELPDHRYEF